MADPEAGGAAHAIKGEVADLKAALVLAYVRPKLCTSARPGGVPKPRRGQGAPARRGCDAAAKARAPNETRAPPPHTRNYKNAEAPSDAEEMANVLAEASARPSTAARARSMSER